MQIDWGDAITGIVGGAALALAGWLCGLPARHRLAQKEKATEAREHAERARADLAEAALLAAQRRRNAPLLVPSDRRFEGLYLKTEQPHRTLFYSARSPQLLSFNREEVERDLPAGERIILVVENRGQESPLVSVQLDGQLIELGQEADLQGAEDRQFLAYPYNPADHGKAQTVQVRFQNTLGVWDTHFYRTEHGRRVLVRIDPV